MAAREGRPELVSSAVQVLTEPVVVEAWSTGRFESAIELSVESIVALDVEFNVVRSIVVSCSGSNTRDKQESTVSTGHSLLPSIHCKELSNMVFFSMDAVTKRA